MWMGIDIEKQVRDTIALSNAGVTGHVDLTGGYRADGLPNYEEHKNSFFDAVTSPLASALKVVSTPITVGSALISGQSVGKALNDNMVRPLRDLAANPAQLTSASAGVLKKVPIVGTGINSISGGWFDRVERSEATYSNLIAGRGGVNFSQTKSALGDSAVAAAQALAAYFAGAAAVGAAGAGAGGATTGVAAFAGGKAGSDFTRNLLTTGKVDLGSALPALSGFTGISIPNEYKDAYNNFSPYLPDLFGGGSKTPPGGAGVVPSIGGAQAATSGAPGNAFPILLVAGLALGGYLLAKRRVAR